MSNKKIWDFWASRYKKLWVQKYSLSPTRNAIIGKMKNRYPSMTIESVMDIGCGVGELIEEIENTFSVKESHGLDYSSNMISEASKHNMKTHWTCIDIHNYIPTTKVDNIICTHSFPYYKDQNLVLSKFKNMMKRDGKLYIAFASNNSYYDMICMSLVKLTTGIAKYPSVKKFKDMTSDRFELISTTLIKEKWYMPSIYLFELELKHE